MNPGADQPFEAPLPVRCQGCTTLGEKTDEQRLELVPVGGDGQELVARAANHQLDVLGSYNGQMLAHGDAALYHEGLA